jgi:hypothetical protein
MMYLISMILILTAGVAALVLVIFMNRDPEQDLKKPLDDCLAWGTGFLLTFGAEFLMLANI